MMSMFNQGCWEVVCECRVGRCCWLSLAHFFVLHSSTNFANYNFLSQLVSDVWRMLLSRIRVIQVTLAKLDPCSYVTTHTSLWWLLKVETTTKWIQVIYQDWGASGDQHEPLQDINLHKLINVVVEICERKSVLLLHALSSIGISDPDFYIIFHQQ